MIIGYDSITSPGIMLCEVVVVVMCVCVYEEGGGLESCPP
jgi:hypothetical protein